MRSRSKHEKKSCKKLKAFTLKVTRSGRGSQWVERDAKERGGTKGTRGREEGLGASGGVTSAKPASDQPPDEYSCDGGGG